MKYTLQELKDMKGTSEPVEQRQRDLHIPTADELRAELAAMQKLLAQMDGA